MTTLSPEREAEIRATAAELGVCAASWEPGACLVGNVTAVRIGRLCDAVVYLLAALDATRAELEAVRAERDALLRDEHSLAERCNRMARDLALLAEVRASGLAETVSEALAFARSAPPDSPFSQEQLNHAAAAFEPLVRLLRGEG